MSDFEQFIKSTLEDYEEPFSPEAWNGFCLKQRKAHRMIILVRCVSAAACVALLLGIGIPLLQDSDTQNVLPGMAIAPVPVSRQPLRLAESAGDTYIVLSAKKMQKEMGIEEAGRIEVIEKQEEIDKQEEIAVAGVETVEEQKMESQTQKMNTNQEASGLDLFEHSVKKSKMLNSWLASAHFSYQSAASRAFAPATYTNSYRSDRLYGSENPISFATKASTPSIFDLENLDVDEIASRIHYSTPLTVGVNVQNAVCDWFAVGLSVTYSLLRSEYDVETSEYEYNVSQRSHYIGIPLTAYFNIVGSPKVNFYAMAGGAVEKGVNCQYDFSLNGTTTHQSKSIKGVQWSAFAGMGLEYKFLSFMGMYLEPSLTYFFDNDQPTSIRTVQPAQFKVEVGLRVRI